MPWFTYAIISTFFFAAQELWLRTLAINSVVPRVSSAIYNAWGAFFAITIFLLGKGSFAPLFSLSATQYLLIASSCLLYGLYERYQFIARKGIEASILTIIFRLETVIASIIAIIVLREPLTLEKTLGTVAIVFASIMLSYKNARLIRNRALFFALLCSVFIGVAMTVDKPASSGIPATLYSVITWTCSVIVIAFPGIKKNQFLKEFSIGNWKIAVAALLNVIGYMLFIQALSYGESSRVVPIVAINSILVVFGGIILLRERDHLWRKIAAGLIAFAGVYLLK